MQSNFQWDNHDICEGNLYLVASKLQGISPFGLLGTVPVCMSSQ